MYDYNLGYNDQLFNPKLPFKESELWKVKSDINYIKLFTIVSHDFQGG